MENKRSSFTRSQAGQSCMPPSTRSTWPVINDESLVTRNATARAISIGLAVALQRPVRHLLALFNGPAGQESGRDQGPGATALTWTL